MSSNERDSQTTTNADDEVQRVFDKFGAILDKAAEIDPVAWSVPLPARMNKRRIRAYREAKAMMSGTDHAE